MKLRALCEAMGALCALQCSRRCGETTLKVSGGSTRVVRVHR